MSIISLIISVLVVGLFLYSKLLPYKDKLNQKYRKIFDFFNALFSPFFSFLKKAIKPFQVGVGLFLDMSQIVLLILLLIILNLL